MSEREAKNGASAVVIGSGVNELVAAHLLARAGRHVTVLEERSSDSKEDGWVPPQILRELGIESQVAVDLPEPWASAALPGGGWLELSRDMARSVEAIRRVSPADADKWPAFCERIGRLAGFLEKMYLQAPRNPLDLQLAFRVRRLGRQGMEDLMRVLPMPVAELLDDWFECDALKGVLAAAGVMHLQQGPRSGGTAFRLLHHHVGSPAGVFRPARSNLRAVLQRLPGIELRAGAGVDRILVREGRAAGVVLKAGEEIPAALVVSGADPRRSLLELVDPGWLDPELVRALRNIRRRGVVARISWVLDQAPAKPNLVAAPTLDYLERAYDESKYGGISRAPYLEARCEDKRVEVHLQYAPYRLAEGAWTDAHRARLGDLAEKSLLQYWPGIAVKQRSVLAPPDLEAREGWPEGQAYHAELALDQALWMRPLPELAHYRTPIAGLWLCGPAMHPGGGIAGAAGYNCVREILRG